MSRRHRRSRSSMGGPRASAHEGGEPNPLFPAHHTPRLVSALADATNRLKNMAEQPMREPNLKPICVNVRQATSEENRALAPYSGRPSSSASATTTCGKKKRKTELVLDTIDKAIESYGLGAESEEAQQAQKLRARYEALSSAIAKQRSKARKFTPGPQREEHVRVETEAQVESLQAEVEETEQAVLALRKEVAAKEGKLMLLEAELSGLGEVTGNTVRQEWMEVCVDEGKAEAEAEQYQQQLDHAQDQFAQLQTELEAQVKQIEQRQAEQMAASLAAEEHLQFREGDDAAMLAEKVKQLRNIVQQRKATKRACIETDAEMRDTLREIEQLEAEVADENHNEDEDLSRDLEDYHAAVQRVLAGQAAANAPFAVILQALAQHDGEMLLNDLKDAISQHIKGANVMSAIYGLVGKQLITIDRSNPSKQKVISRV